MKKVLLVTGIFLLILALAGIGLLGTSRGSQQVVQYFMARFASDNEVAYGNVSGSLIRGMTFEDVAIPLYESGDRAEGPVFRAGKIAVDVNSLSFKGLNVFIENARLGVPLSDPVVLAGSLTEGMLDVNVYTHAVAIGQIVDLIPDPAPELREYSGTLTDVDLFLKGPVDRPSLTGQLTVREAKRDGFALVDCRVRADLSVERLLPEPRFKGRLVFEGGRVSGPKTAQIHLVKGTAIWDEINPEEPRLDVRAEATVEKTKINIVLQGTAANPDITLTSSPPLSHPRLLMMLVTNKSWQGADKISANGQVPVSFLGDFIDYFFLAGEGSQMKEKLGIKDIYIKYDGQTKGFGMRKELVGPLDAIYEVEQESGGTAGEETRRQKIGGAYRINENLSVTAKRDLVPDNKDGSQDSSNAGTKADTEVKMEFKKKF